MAEVFYFHVQEDRSIKYKLLEPIMQEDKDVATWRFRIPKVLNQIDMSTWSWWFVYVNAKGQKFSELLTLNNDIDDPESFSTADYSIGYGISKTPGGFTFALEAINAEQDGEISGEWHTRTYTHTVTPTLQGNQAEYAETESDVISALMQEVRNKVNQLVGGATPLPVNLKSLMTDHDKVYLYTGEEPNESTGYWYYYNGTQFVPGGLYAKPTDEQTAEAIDAWLTDHPEATTTVQDGAITEAKLASDSVSSDKVQDGAITEAKLADELKLKTIKDYVTPEMYGAVGDGVADDFTAVQTALNTKLPVKGTSGKSYYVSQNLTGYNDVSDISLIFATKKMMIFTDVSDVTIKDSYFEMLGRVTDLSDRGQYALAFTYCVNIHILNNHFYHFTSNVICNVSSNIFVEGNYFYDSFQNANEGNGYGVVLQCCKMVSITNNHFKDIQRHSIYISWSDAYDEDPRFEGYNHWCENVVVNNNIFEITNYDNDGWNRTSTEQQVKVLSSKNVSIENNQFIGTYGAVFFATDENDPCENISINNNIIKDQASDYRAIIVELWQGIGSPINKNISICGNVFHNTTKYPCIKLSKVDGLLVSDNIAIESSEYKTGFDYFVMLYHESSGADKTLDCYKNIKIANNQINKRGLIKLYCEQDTYGLGIVENVELNNNNVCYTGMSIFSGVTYTKLDGFRILHNVINGASGASIFMPLYTSGFEGDNIFIIGNDLSGEVRVFDSTFTGKIYFLQNINYSLASSGLPSSSVNDVYEYQIVSSGDMTLPASLEVGNNEVSVTFPRELRQVPMAVMFVLYDSKFVPNFFSPLSLKSGSLTKTGFTAIVQKLQASSSAWVAKYIVIGKH